MKQYFLKLRYVTALAAYAGHISAASAAQPIPFKQPLITAEQDLTGAATGFCVCIVILALALYLLRRHLNSGKKITGRERAVMILDSQRLTPKATLYVVKFGTSQYLIAHNESGAQCLASHTNSSMPSAAP